MAREPAWRIFAQEFSDSIVLEKRGEEKEANYILTRLGAKVNRVMAVGIMENKNVMNENSFITGTLNDLTGTFHFSADRKYSSHATWNFLTSAEPPVRVAIVGKVRTYGETKNLDLRIETIVEYDEFLEEYWKLTAIKNMLLRIQIIRDMQNGSDRKTLEKVGYPPSYIESILLAGEMFKDHRVDSYINLAKQLLGMEVEEEKSQEDPEMQILDLVGKLDFDGKGARYEDIVENAMKINMDRSTVDELLNSLLEKGLIYEPSVNFFKKL